jgi:hypothetical protein
VPLDRSPLRRSGQTRFSGGPQAHTSALMRATELRGQMMRSSLGMGAGWQSKVIKHDREGPGVVGYYLDTVSLLASLCPLIPEVQGRDGKWVRSDDPVLNVVVSGYRTPLFEQHDLVASHVRAREAVGEAWVIWSEDVGWHVVTVPNVAAVTGVAGAVQWTDLYGVTRKTPGTQVYKSWVPDPYQPWMPHSPLRRALPNIRRIHSAVRSQNRAADSRLVMNGLLAFPDENEARPLRTEHPDGQDAQREGIDDVINDYMSLAQKAYTDDDSVAAVVPFPYLGQAAVPVELGRDIDQYAIPMEDKGIEGFARDVNFPAQLLTSGPGTSNHWNEWLLAEIQQKMGLAPKLIPVCADITTIYYRPMVRQIRNRVGSWDVDPARTRVAPDYSFLASKPDKAGKAIEAYRAGIIDRDECMTELGYKEQFELPKGLTEYEHWQIVNGRPGAPYVEVDGEGRIIIPDAGGSPFGEAPPPEGLDAPIPAPDDPGMVDAGPPPLGPPEQAPVAALGDPEDPQTARVEAALVALTAIDVALAAKLEATASAAATAAMVEVAKAVIRAYPSKDPRREALRDLPPEEVWAAADPVIRATVDVESVAEQALAPYRPQIEEQLAEAQAAIEEAFDQQDWSVPEILVALAAAAIVAGVVSTVVGWAFDPAKFTRDAIAKPLVKRALRIPPAIITAAMMVAGGAAAGLDGRIVRGANGSPVPATGGPWEGGTGTATGHNAVEKIRESLWLPPNTGVTLKWRHGILRTPKEPFPPHVALDGYTFGDLSQVPGGYHPQDHPWCSCLLVPTLTKRTYVPEPLGLES